MPAPVTVNPIQKCMRLLVTSHGRNRQHMQFELAATARKKQWMCFSHINGHGPTRRDVLTNEVQALVQFKQFGRFKQKHMP